MLEEEIAERKTPEVVNIPLRNKKHEIVAYALIDKQDEERISPFFWYRTVQGYAQTSMHCAEKGKKASVKMHRFILSATATDPSVDHINHIKIDNRRDNLRFVSASVNSHNQKKRKNTASQYYGVSKVPNGWQATCKGKHAGLYENETHAAFAYNLKALELFGAEANLNDIAQPLDFVPWERKKAKNAQICRGLTIIQEIDKPPCYRVRVCINGKENAKRFTDRKEAENQLLEWRAKANEISPVGEIVRDAQGIAVLPCFNGNADQCQVKVQVDDSTYCKFFHTRLHLSEGGYPVAGKLKLLHRYVMNAQPGQLIDHKDGNKLNAQESNLRIATHSLNAHNRKKSSSTTSCYMGVSIVHNRFQVRVAKDGVQYYGGRYQDEDVGGWAADQLSLELFGQDARQNGVILDDYVFVDRRAVQIEDA